MGVILITCDFLPLRKKEDLSGPFVAGWLLKEERELTISSFKG